MPAMGKCCSKYCCNAHCLYLHLHFHDTRIDNEGSTQMPEMTEFHPGTRRGGFNEASLSVWSFSRYHCCLLALWRADSGKNGQHRVKKPQLLLQHYSPKQQSVQFTQCSAPTSGLRSSAVNLPPFREGQQGAAVGVEIKFNDEAGNLQRQIPQPSNPTAF